MKLLKFFVILVFLFPLNFNSWGREFSLFRSNDRSLNAHGKAALTKNEEQHPDSIFKIYDLYRRCIPSSNSLIFEPKNGSLIFMQKSLSDGIQKLPLTLDYIVLKDSVFEDMSDIRSPSQFLPLCLDSIQNCLNPYNPDIYWRRSVPIRKNTLTLNGQKYTHFGYEGFGSFFESRKDEIIGYKKYIWEYDSWNFLENEFKTKKTSAIDKFCASVSIHV